MILPSSRITIDRPVIQRHLLSDSVSPIPCSSYLLLLHMVDLFIYFLFQSDPFNRSHLTQEMLIPNVELKARIEEFIRSQELKRHGDLVGMQSDKVAMQTGNVEMTLLD